MKPDYDEIEMSYDDEEGEEHVVVVEYASWPYVPARMYLSNGDPGYPAEGGEVEIQKITDLKGNELFLPAAIEEMFIERIMDRLSGLY